MGVHVASVSLLIILACGTGLLILVQGRWVELLGLIGLSLACAALIWQQIAQTAAADAAMIVAASAAVGGVTATLIVGIHLLRYSGAAALEPQPNLQVWRLMGAALLIVLLVAAPPLEIAPMLEAALLLLVGGTVICLTLDRQQRAGGGLVILLLGFHLLYLAMTSRISILELLLLDSLPIGAVLVLASLPAARDDQSSSGWTQIPVEPELDSKEPFI